MKGIIYAYFVEPRTFTIKGFELKKIIINNSNVGKSIVKI